MDVLIENEVGREFVRTAWKIYLDGKQQIPQLTSAYLSKKSREKK